MDEHSKRQIFRTCFVALMATSFGFMLRAMLISQWGAEFKLTNTQMGEIMGVGLWPFAISIVLFSLIVDRIGYGKAMMFAFTCHISSVIITLLADGYWMLYIGTLIFALGNGSIEAIINPAVATMYRTEKTKWINILHAGWPGGMVAGGIMALSMGTAIRWEFKLSVMLIPMLIYGFMMLGKKFPVSERIAAGVSFRDMLKELGFFGALIIFTLMVLEVGKVFGIGTWSMVIVIAAISIPFGIYSKSWGRPVFIVLLLIMFPLATTELGTDSWIVDLMASEMEGLGMQAGWILVYTALIMTFFRFMAGHLLRVFKPIGLLIFCSAIATLGLMWLSFASGIIIFVAATVYGFAKSYLWPTMIGIVGERFPKGGALTLNMTTGVGMMAVGIIGAVFLGFTQDKQIEKNLMVYDQENNTSLTVRYISEDKYSVMGKYRSLNFEEIKDASLEEKEILHGVQTSAKKRALMNVAALPALMTVSFVLLWIYFKRKGGYQQVDIHQVNS